MSPDQTAERTAHRLAQRSWRTRAGLAGTLAGALLLAACTSPVPTPEPDAVPETPPPALTESQQEAVLDAVGASLEEAGEANDASLLEARVTGPALTIRSSQLAVASTLGTSDLVTTLPTEVQQVVIPTTQTWPRTSYAVSVQPEDLQSPRLMAFEQPAPRAQYELWGWVRLFPSTTMPSFAEPGIGSEAVAPDDDSLVVTPADALAQYADVLNLGDGSAYAGTFPDDAFRQLLAENARVQNEALAVAEGSQSMTFTPNPDEPVRAVRTADGGALVMGAMTSLESRTAEEGATISPSTETEKALFGSTEPSNTLDVAYVDMVAMYVPPAEADDTQVQVLGVEHVATSVAVP